MPKSKVGYRLHGWDDEKIYLWSDKDKREYCVSDEEELYNRLLKICIEYFEEKREDNDRSNQGNKN